MRRNPVLVVLDETLAAGRATVDGGTEIESMALATAVWRDAARHHSRGRGRASPQRTIGRIAALVLVVFDPIIISSAVARLPRDLDADEARGQGNEEAPKS